MKNNELVISGEHHKQVWNQLYRAGSSVNFALALCGRLLSPNLQRLLVHKVILVDRDPSIAERSEVIQAAFEDADKRGQSVIVIGATMENGLADGNGGWERKFGSEATVAGKVIMAKDGSMHGVTNDLNLTPFSAVKLVGDELYFWANQEQQENVKEFAIRHVQLFGQGTFNKLKNLKVGVVGCSGTGSPVIEQLARLGVGHLLLVDPDHVEEKNTNRILNSTLKDCRRKASKVAVLKKAVKKIGLKTKVETYESDLSSPKVIRAIAECDVVFGCMDSVDGRHLLNRISTFYLLPYFDIGIKLVADGKGGIDQVCGSVHYLQPGGSSLLSRGVYTLDQLYSANLKKSDAAEYEERLKSKYIEGVDEDRPAVISVNMLFAALAVNEFLARIHPYKDDPNSEYAVFRISLTQGMIYKDSDTEPCAALLRHVGRGDVKPLLDMPQLTEEGDK